MRSMTPRISFLSQMWLPGGQAVDPHVEDLVADLLGDAEAAGRVLDVGDAVVDVVLLEDDGQGLLQDGAPGVAHDVPDQQDVHPDRLSAGFQAGQTAGCLSDLDLGRPRTAAGRDRLTASPARPAHVPASRGLEGVEA